MKKEVQSKELHVIFHLFTKTLHIVIVPRWTMMNIGALLKLMIRLAATLKEIGEFVTVPVLQVIVEIVPLPVFLR